MRISDWSSDVCSSDLGGFSFTGIAMQRRGVVVRAPVAWAGAVGVTRGRPAHSSGSTAPRRSFSLRRGRAGTQCHSSSPGLPEVTTCAGCVASAPYPPQHARMRFSPFLLPPTLRPLMHTLVLAGTDPWLAVAPSMPFLDPGHVLLGWLLRLVFLSPFFSAFHI